MTVAQAAKLLEVSPDLIYRLCREGRLAHVRIGLKRGVIRIDRADIDAYLAGRRIEAENESDGPAEPVIATARGPIVVRNVLAERHAARMAASARRKRRG